MKKLLVITIAMALLALSSCATRNIVKVKDSKTSPLTVVETIDTKYLFHPAFIVGVHHRFWTCTDKGEELQCKSECDYETDKDCPGFGLK